MSEDIVSAGPAQADEASLLDLPADALIIRNQRRAFAGEVIVEVTRAAWRPDAFQLRLQLGTAD